MEQEILQTLQEIRGMLLVLIVFFLILGILFIYAVLAQIFPSLMHRSTSDKAEELFDKGKFNDIVKLCETKLTKKPNHLNSIWWLAKAKYNLKEYEVSQRLFASLLEKEPNWKTEYITPYLEKLNELNSTANKSLNRDPKPLT